MRVLVCGGRDFDDLPLLGDALERVHARHVITLLIHGGAQGADTAAHHWAAFKRVPVRVFHADWGQFGSGAGPIRNSKMLAEGKPEMVLAFPGGRGTANMVKQARSAGVSVCEVSRTADWWAEAIKAGRSDYEQLHRT